jgi:hypothetical protein
MRLILVFFIFMATLYGSSIFDDVKTPTSDMKDDMFSDEYTKSNSIEFDDSMKKAQIQHKLSLKFESYIKEAKKKADYNEFEEAYKVLDKADEMDFDIDRVEKTSSYIATKEKQLLERKREEAERKERARRNAARMAAMERKREQQKYNEMASWNAFREKVLKEHTELWNYVEKTDRDINERYAELRDQYQKKSSFQNYNSYDTNIKSENQLDREYKQRKILREQKREQRTKNYEASCSSSSDCSGGLECFILYGDSKGKCREKGWIRETGDKIQKQHKETLKKEAAKKERAKYMAEQSKKKEQAQQESAYLNKLKSSITLGVKNCFGEHHVGGQIKSKKDGCINVYFEASCNNSSSIYEGVFENMVTNIGGCYGDTVKISPKLNCKTSEYNVRVVKVERCY